MQSGKTVNNSRNNPKIGHSENMTTTMGTVYSIASQKGGTGKSSTSISVGAALARRGKRVLLIDIDSQANSSKILLPNYQDIDFKDTIYVTILERKPLRVHPTSVPNLFVVPSHILLTKTDIELTTAIDHREARLRIALDKIKNEYDFVIIDCPPALSWLTINAFTASDYIIVVISPGYFELDSTVQIDKTIKEVQDFFNPALKMRGFLFTMSEPTISTKTSLEVLRRAYPEHVLNTVIPKNQDMSKALFKKMDIFAYNPESKSAMAYQKLVEEVFI